jgi:hypothetical protein
MKGKIRSSGEDWPDLDHALFEWQQRMEQKKSIITGEILKTKARELWAALPQCDTVGGQKSARFSHFTAKLDLLTPLTLIK